MVPGSRVRDPDGLERSRLALARRGIRDYDLLDFEPSDLSWKAEDTAIKAATPIFAGLPVAVEVRNGARVYLSYEAHFGVPCPPYSSGLDRVLCGDPARGG